MNQKQTEAFKAYLSTLGSTALQDEYHDLKVAVSVAGAAVPGTLQAKYDAAEDVYLAKYMAIWESTINELSRLSSEADDPDALTWEGYKELKDRLMRAAKVRFYD